MAVAPPSRLCYPHTVNPNFHDAPASLRETAAWHWLAFDSGLGLRRAKSIAEEQRPADAVSLYELLLENAEVWAAALRLTDDEKKRLQSNYDRLSETGQRLIDWQTHGIHILHRGDPAYPATLTAHLRPEQRPLLLCHHGNADLFDLPTILPLAGDPPDADATAWTSETLLALSDEGALPLLLARPGLDASLARSLLQTEAAFALVLPQGLAAYQPPAALAAVIASGRCLLLSPFRPDQPAAEPNPLLPHAAVFAQALANALLIVTPPHPQGLLPEQPCFLRPGLPKTLGCQTYYADPEDLFLRLIETPSAAALANQPALTPPEPALSEAPSLPPPPDPEALIRRLSELGHVPEAMKTRLRQPPTAT